MERLDYFTLKQNFSLYIKNDYAFKDVEIILDNPERKKLIIFGLEIEQDIKVLLHIKPITEKQAISVFVQFFFSDIDDMSCECDNDEKKAVFLSFNLHEVPEEMKDYFKDDFEAIELIVSKIANNIYL
jgi:hypothetical protein